MYEGTRKSALCDTFLVNYRVSITIYNYKTLRYKIMVYYLTISALHQNFSQIRLFTPSSFNLNVNSF